MVADGSGENWYSYISARSVCFMEYAINDQAVWVLIIAQQCSLRPSNQDDPGILINLSDEIAKSSAAMWLKGPPFFQLKMFPVSLSQTNWFIQGSSHPITFVEPLSHAEYFYSRPMPCAPSLYLAKTRHCL